MTDTQLELFDSAPAVRGRQIEEHIYGAVLALRRHKFLVYAAGYRRHKVIHRGHMQILDADQLQELAAHTERLASAKAMRQLATRQA